MDGTGWKSVPIIQIWKDKKLTQNIFLQSRYNATATFSAGRSLQDCPVALPRLMNGCRRLALSTSSCPPVQCPGLISLSSGHLVIEVRGLRSAWVPSAGRSAYGDRAAGGGKPEAMCDDVRRTPKAPERPLHRKMRIARPPCHHFVRRFKAPNVTTTTTDGTLVRGFGPWTKSN